MKTEIYDVGCQEPSAHFILDQDQKWLITDGKARCQRLVLGFEQDARGGRALNFGRDNIDFGDESHFVIGTKPHDFTEFTFQWNGNIKKWQVVNVEYGLIAPSGKSVNPVQSVKVATYSNIDIQSPPYLYENHIWAQGDRVLVKNQTNPLENGIWRFVGSGYALVREHPLPAPGDFVFVEKGFMNGDKGFVFDGTQWSQFSGSTHIEPPAGLCAGNLVCSGVISSSNFTFHQDEKVEVITKDQHEKAIAELEAKFQNKMEWQATAVDTVVALTYNRIMEEEVGRLDDVLRVLDLKYEKEISELRRQVQILSQDQQAPKSQKGIPCGIMR